MKVLGIETSCDETAVAVLCQQQGLLSNHVYSQTNLHREFGGVVPELASRDHIRKLSPLIKKALQESDLVLATDIDAIAYTAGPGLMGALLVGAGLARSLAWASGKPSIPVHHMEAHLLAPLLEGIQPNYPYVALLVSGGHTLLVQVNSIGDYHILGETIDDAVGEAFDKTAQLLGFEYPGGPTIQQWAKKGRSGEFNFPRPMTDRPGLDFSFSGLKTHVLNTLKNLPQIDDQVRADIACEFEDAVVDTLTIKALRAIQLSGAKTFVVAGGVGANEKLRRKLKQELTNVSVFYPAAEFCTDNAAMVAQVGMLRLHNDVNDSLEINVQARWSLETL